MSKHFLEWFKDNQMKLNPHITDDGIKSGKLLQNIS